MTLPTPVNSTIKGLNIRGGGIRGILPLTFCKELSVDNNNISLYKSFDFFSGISVGAIVAAFHALQISPEVAIKFFYDSGSNVFRKSIGRSITTGFGAISSFYKIEWLISALDKCFNGALFKDAKKPLIIGSVDQLANDFVVFKSWEPWGGNLKMAEVVAASCAAQLYFDPVKLTIDNKNYVFSDGGNSGNSISDGLDAEISNLYGQDQKRIIVDISCGKSNDPNDYAAGGLFSWLYKGRIVILALECSTSKTSYIMNTNLGNDYYEFDLLLQHPVALDAADINTMKLLQSEAARMKSVNIDRYKDLLSRLSSYN